MTFENGTIIGGPHNGRVVGVNPGGNLLLPVPVSSTISNATYISDVGLVAGYERQENKIAEYRHHKITANGKVIWFWLPVEVDEGADAIAYILNRAVRHSAT